MRPLETALLLFTFIAVVQVFAFNHPQPQLGRRVGVALLAVAALLLHVFIEGARWQCYPVYAVTVFTLLAAIMRSSGPTTRLFRWGGLLGSLVLLALGGGIAWALPVPVLPRVATLGTFNQFLTDDTRTESYGPSPGGPRKYVAQFWYPADPGSIIGKGAQPWSPESMRFGKAIADEVGVPAIFLSHLGMTTSNAYADAELSSEHGDKLPVVLYSHGWTGFRTIAASEVEALAAAGFIVIAPDHTYGAMGTVFPDGSVHLNDPEAMPADKDPNRQAGIEKLVDSYAGDLKHLLDLLPKLDSGEIASPLKGRIDLDRIGVFGHSTGGAAVVEIAKSDERVKALVGLDIWGEPVSAELRAKPRDIPAASIRSQDWHDNRTKDRDILYQILDSFATPTLDLYLADSRHGDFTILPIFSPIVGRLIPHQRGTVSAADALESVDGFLVDFFTAHLKPSGKPLPVPPETTHPALRPATRPANP